LANSESSQFGVTVMPAIPYPDVPNYPGVPSIPRTSAGSPSINISLASNQPLVISSQEPIWGIFSAKDNTPFFTPATVGTLSTYSFDYSRQSTVSTFPVETGSFASYDKIWTPAHPVVTLAFSGSEADKWNLLANLELACGDTSLWNVITPDAEYDGYTIARYSYRRMSNKGATMLLIDVMLEEIKQVTLSYANTPGSVTPTPSPVTPGKKNTTPTPQSPAAAPTKSSGQIQPSTPSSETLKDVKIWIMSALGITPPSA